MGKIIKYFFKGLLVLVPLVITVYVFYLVFRYLDKFFINIPFPGVGLLVTVLLVVVIGFLASNIVTQKYFNYLDSMFGRLPIIKIMYSSIKDLVNAFVGSEKKFDKPVLVTIIPESGVKVLGFVTSENMECIGLKDNVAVYMPQSYNLAGNMIIVPKERIQVLNISSAKAMTLIVSAAVSGKNEENKKEK
jgi:uncharacterized membrane protein